MTLHRQDKRSRICTALYFQIPQKIMIMKRFFIILFLFPWSLFGQTECTIASQTGFWFQPFCSRQVQLPVLVDGLENYQLFYDYGDGNIGNSTSHFYAEDGNYEVCVYAEGEGCTTNTYCQTMQVLGPYVSFVNCPMDTVRIGIDNYSSCTNESFVPDTTATTCLSGHTTVVTCIRSDGASDLSAPWPVGITTVTCYAQTIPLAPVFDSCQWVIEVVDEVEEVTFDMDFTNVSEAEKGYWACDGIAASNGEYVSIGYVVESEEPNRLFFMRQDEEGNEVGPLVEWQFEANEGLSPTTGSTFEREAFIIESINDQGISDGYYIATTAYSELVEAPSYDILALKADHEGNVVWQRHLQDIGTNEYVKGIDIDDSGNLVILSEKFVDTDQHYMEINQIMADGEMVSCTHITYPVQDGIPPDNFRFSPYDIRNVQNLGAPMIQYAVSGTWIFDGSEYVGVYLLNEAFEVLDNRIFTYDLRPDLATEKVWPTTIIQKGANLVIGGSIRYENNTFESFLMEINPVNATGLLDGSILWANRYFEDLTPETFGRGWGFLELKKSTENHLLVTGIGESLNEHQYPVLMEFDETGNFLNGVVFISGLNGEQVDEASLISLDLALDESPFLVGRKYNQLSDQPIFWSAKTASTNQLFNCDCFLDITTLQEPLTPELFIIEDLEQDVVDCNVKEPMLTATMDSLMREVCDQHIPNEEHPLCEVEECSTDTLIINTGYDHTIDQPYGIGSFDAFWTLVESPFESIKVPRPAYVVNPNDAWVPPAESQWISAFPQAALEDNNEPPSPPYALQTCFCICEDSSLVELDFSVLADDSVSVFLQKEDGTQRTHLVDHLGFSPYITPSQVNTAIFLDKGTYCISAEMRNKYSVAMGLNIDGYITGANLISHICCGNYEGVITGLKYHDRNCNGVPDNQGELSDADFEEGLPDWEIILCDLNGNGIDTAYTDQFGYYTFSNVEPGDYIVKESPQDQWEATAPASMQYEITVDALEVVGSLDFGNKYTGPVELDYDFTCVTNGTAAPIRWIGGACDCTINIQLQSCGEPVFDPSELSVLINHNPGSFDFNITNLEPGDYQFAIQACNGEYMDIGSCFTVTDLEASFDYEIGECGEVEFSATASEEVTFAWSFDDATAGNGANISHVYAGEGPYDVELTATTEEGCSVSYTVSVNPELCDNECGEIVNESLEYSCEDFNSFDYTFQFLNNTEFEITSVLITNVSVDGVTFSDPFFNFYQFPIVAGPGSLSEEINLSIAVAFSFLEPFEVCFDVIYLTNGNECCHYQHCITLGLPDVCEYLAFSPGNKGQECLYEVRFENNYCPNTLIGLETEILTPGVSFGEFSSGVLQPEVNSDFTNIFWSHEDATLPNDIFSLEFGFDGVVSASQIPQQVVFNWYGYGNDGTTWIFCSDTIEYHCTSCLAVEGTVDCAPESRYNYQFEITNFTGQQTNIIAFEVHTPDVIFEPEVFQVDLADGETFSDFLSIRNENGGYFPPDTEVEFKVLLFDNTGWCCHLDDVSLLLPDCFGSEIDEHPTPSSESLIIYPVPTRDVLNIKLASFGNFAISIFSSRGKILTQETVYLKEEELLQLEIANLPSGIYFLRLQGEDGRVHQKKFIKID